MRTFRIALALTLVACESKPAVENEVAMAKPDDRIECAVDGAAVFSGDCAIERSDSKALTLRHKNGGFRRLMLEADGTIDTADGAETMTVHSLRDGRTEIAVGEDRYRLPAGL